ncbi:hypothetical protein [Hypericibacter sp.]|uniref:hypothetical protein n=1 Tax=Hypericibacter sp. TaxID=2705401 RepID=UPI003D6CD644
MDDRQCFCPPDSCSFNLTAGTTDLNVGCFCRRRAAFARQAAARPVVALTPGPATAIRPNHYGGDTP